MKTHGEILAPTLAVRNLRKQQFVELRIVGVRLDHGIHHGANELVEWRPGVLHELGCEEAVDLLYVALVQGFKDGRPIREVLVQRADTDAGNLSDPVGGDRFKILTTASRIASTVWRARRCCGCRRMGDFALLDGMRTSVNGM
jgi:hypothetical protein